ncbi:MAG: 3-deoxy-manno-octulosonate cytidylyltransferase, partial [Candidatus Aminicenantes bacterium]|nr:3-deoxy-manno-octulosonate cytidylyltransferase [Candidatus Aminicenantes bacterium]
MIPVRYGSRRFPGKPLAPILGKPMVQWVYQNARRAALLSRVVVATDDQRILEAARGFGAEAVLTSTEHVSGTDRVAEVADRLDVPIILNIQGDEPLLDPAMLDSLVEALQDVSIPMATLVRKNTDLSRIQDENVVKVVRDVQGNALYFSRSPLPFQAKNYFWEHVGLYGFQRPFLLELKSLTPSKLEKEERLEQLRVLEHGFKINVLETTHS